MRASIDECGRGRPHDSRRDAGATRDIRRPRKKCGSGDPHDSRSGDRRYKGRRRYGADWSRKGGSELQRRKLEGLYGFGLDGVDLADGDGGDVEIFSAGGRASEAAEHGELADVGERVCDGPLHEPVDMRVNWVR